LLCTPKKIEKKYFFLESNHKILYFTCLKSHDISFSKFGYIDWKILAFKVGQKVFY